MSRPIQLTPLALLTFVWLAAVLWLGQRGAFGSDGYVPVALVPAVVLPVLAATLGWFALPGLRARLDETSLATLVGLQSFRVIGITLLFVWGLDLLPTLLAWIAAVGDAAVGMLALHTTIRIAEGHADAARLARRVTIAGLADFAVVLTIAILSSRGMPLAFPDQPLPMVMQDLPLVAIPAFIVPLFIIFHLAVLAKLRSRN